MYALTKVYKTKAQAVNAIRMTANNKGWTVLDTDAALEHVWPAMDGFTVNNVTLNIALGFVAQTAEQVNGPALDAVNVALAEQARKEIWGTDGNNTQQQAHTNMAKLSTKTKLQAHSKLELDKKAAKQNVLVTENKQTRCNVVNNARRPLKGKTLLVWETTERLQAVDGNTPSCKQVLAALPAGFNKTTCGIQYYACLAFNGWNNARKDKK